MRSRYTIATPPGATIREQLADRGMSQKEFAQRMDMSEKHISRLINGEVRLTPDVALRLESVLGVPADFWNGLEAIYQEKKARAEAENAMEADEALAQRLPYKEMARNGWIPDASNVSDRIAHLRRFFEVANLGVIENLATPGIACRQLSTKESCDYTLAVWAQKARIEARGIHANRINLKLLEDSIPEIRSMTTENPEEFCPRLMRIFADCGIALVFLPHIGGSFLHGASFYDGEKIVMGLSVRGRDADRFWFSLFHEIAHILKGHIGKPEGTTDEDEHQADVFAANTLISMREYEEFTNAKHFTKETVITFSRKVKIDPGIVVGRLQNDNFVPYSWFNAFKTKYKIAE